MATSGLVDTAMRVYNAALGTTHMDVGEGEIQNLSAFRTYMWGDSAAFKLAACGKSTFDWKLNSAEGNHLKRINEGGVRSLSRTDNVDTASQRLVKYYQDYAVLDAEIEDDSGLMMLLEAGRIDMFCEKLYSIEKSKLTEATVTLANDMERLTAAVPHYTDMELRTLPAEQAYSYFALVNDDWLSLYGVVTATGIPASSGAAGGGTPGTDHNTFVGTAAGGGIWYNKQNLHPNDARFTLPDGRNVYAPRRYGYDSITPNAIDGFFTVLVRSVRQTEYKQVPPIEGMHSRIEAPINADRVIYMSSKGADMVQSGTLTTQDLWTSPSRRDPAVMNPTVRGVALEEWDMLNTAALYDGTSRTVKVTEGQGDLKGPRFYMHNRRTLFPVAHRLNWFRKRIADGNQLIPDLQGKYVDVKWTWACIDFRSQAIVRPTTAALLAAY